MLVTDKLLLSAMNGCSFEPDADIGSLPTKTCHRCKEPIMDRFVMRVHPNYEFHPACLSCASCHATLDETCTCFVRNGIPYCKSDYFKFFGVHCNECKEVITDRVMKAGDRGYHVDCFKCCVCMVKLEPGDYYTIHNDKIYCKDDIEALYGDNDTSSSANEAGSPTSEGSGCALPTSPGKQKSEKTPRVRTVLSDKQLKILKAVYSQNPKPDSLMKEHLCEVTGLSPRVIRVWFQNKRCKDKKKILQDKAIEESAQLQGMGLPMSVQTPITPLTPLTPETTTEIPFSINSGPIQTNGHSHTPPPPPLNTSPVSLPLPPPLTSSWDAQTSSWDAQTCSFNGFSPNLVMTTAPSHVMTSQ